MATDNILTGTSQTGSAQTQTQQKKAYDPRRRKAMLDMLASGKDPNDVRFIHTMSGFDQEEADDAINTFYSLTGIPNPTASQKPQGGFESDYSTQVRNKINSFGAESERNGATGAVAALKSQRDIMALLDKKDAEGNSVISTGPIAGRSQKAAARYIDPESSQADLRPGKDFQDFNAATTAFTANFIKALSGVQVSDKEREFLMNALPSPDKQEDENRNGMEQLTNFLKNSYEFKLGMKLDVDKLYGVVDDNGNIVEDQPVAPVQKSHNDQAYEWAQANPDDEWSPKIMEKLNSVGYKPVAAPEASDNKYSLETEDDPEEIKSSGFFDQPEEDTIDKLGGVGETLGKFFGGNVIGEAIGNLIGGQLAKHGEAGQTLQDTFQKYVELKQQGKISEEQYNKLVTNLESTAKDAFGYDGPSFKQIAADTGKVALSVLGGPALKGATKLGTLGRFAGMGAGQGALEEQASNEDATIGSTLASSAVGATTSTALLGTGATLAKAFNVVTGKSGLQKFANNVTQSLGMTGKMTAASASETVPKAVRGYSAILEEAKDAMVKDSDGVEKVFNPKDASFGETVQALVKAKNSIYSKYTSLAQEAGDAGASVSSSDVSKVISELQKTSENSTGATKSKVNSVIKDIQDNFGAGGKLKESVDFKDVQKFIEALNVDVNPMSDKAGAQVSASASKLFRDILDDKISTSTGQGYQILRNKYADVKGIEDALVNQFKKAARGSGSGVSDWVSGVGGTDAIVGILTGNTGQAARGVGLGIMAKVVKHFRDPEVKMRKVFEVIEKQAAKDGGYGKIAQNVTEAVTPSEFGVVGKTIQKANKTIIDKAKSIRPGMNIQDISPRGTEARKKLSELTSKMSSAKNETIRNRYKKAIQDLIDRENK